MMQEMKLASAESESGNGWFFFFFSLQKATLVSAVDVYEEEESELLISFNRESF